MEIGDIGLPACRNDLSELPEGTFLLDSCGGLMVRGNFGEGEKVYCRDGNTTWGIPLFYVQTEGNGAVSARRNWWDRLEYGSQEYLWADHLLGRAPPVGLEEGVLRINLN